MIAFLDLGAFFELVKFMLKNYITENEYLCTPIDYFSTFVFV